MIQIVMNNLVPKGAQKPFDIFGDIHFEIDGYCFPSEDWDDFVSPILYWWQARLSEMIENEKDTCELLFMDGNCSVIVHDQGETVDMDFIMRDRIERTITGINKAELCSVVNEALESLDIPHLKQ